jgi:hypothetical protein
MTEKLKSLSKEIADNIKQLNDLSEKIQRQFDDFMYEVTFKSSEVQGFYKGIFKSIDKENSDADMFWFVKTLTNPECPYWDLEVGKKATFLPADVLRYHYRIDDYVYCVELEIHVDDNNVVTGIDFNTY